MISQYHRHKIMAYETVKTESAARGLVNHKVKVSNDRSVWIKTAPGTSQSDLDKLVDESLSIEAIEKEKVELREKQLAELHLPLEERTV